MEEAARFTEVEKVFLFHTGSIKTAPAMAPAPKTEAEVMSAIWILYSGPVVISEKSLSPSIGFDTVIPSQVNDTSFAFPPFIEMVRSEERRVGRTWRHRGLC